MTPKNPEPQDEHSASKGDGGTARQLAAVYRELAPYLNIGYFFIASISLLAWIGWQVDAHWGTKPWGVAVGAILGVIVGFYNFFRTVWNGSSNDRES